MKNLTLAICGLFCTNILFSQKIVDVTEQTIRLGAMDTEEMYFGFAEGDQVVLNFFETDRKNINLEILGYPVNYRFTESRGKTENETVTISTTGVYQFRFHNTALSDRACKIKIQRIPAFDETAALNTTAWQMQNDNSFYTASEQYVIKQEYASQQIIAPVEFYIGNSAYLSPGGKSRIVFPVQLPENTVEWYYQVAVFRDKQEETKKFFNLAGDLTELMEQQTGLNFGLDLLPPLAGTAYCDVFVMDRENATCFEAEKDFSYSLIGSNEHIRSGIIKVHGGSSTPLYLGIKNPDPGNGAHMVLECVAIVSKEKKAAGEVEKVALAGKRLHH